VRRRERRRPSAQRAVKPGDTLKLVLTTPYLRRIALMVSLVAIVTLWTGFQFQSLAEARFAANADHLTRLFADFNSSMGVIALLIQLVVSGPALRKFGLASTILMFPVTLACGLVAVALTGSLWAVVLTNAFDQVLRFSVDRPTFELLYVPIRSDVKPRVKAAIDLTINRLADGIGGVLLGLATTGFSLVAFKIPGAGLGIRGVAVMSLVLVAAWIAVALALRRGYVGAIRDSIAQHRLETERASVRTLDRAATDLLAARLNASDPGEILYALDVFRVQHLGLMHPAVRGLLHHPAPEVRLRAISVLDQAGDTSVIPDIDALLADPEPGVRAEALLYLAHHADVDPLARITALRDFPDYSIQAGLVAFLGRDSAWQNIEASRVILRQMIARKDADGVRGRIEAARLLSQFPGMFGEELQALLDDPDESVVRAALAACGHPTHAADIERVLPRLADKRYRDAAVQALTGMGPDIVPVLREVLEDSTEPAGVRAEVPNVLAATGGTAARDVLLDNLLEPDVGLRTHIIVGLNRLHSRHPEIEVDRQAIEMVLTAEIMGHYRSYQILGSLGASFESDDQVAKGIRHVIEHEQQRIFRLLDSLLPDTDMKSVYVALRSTNPTMRGNATELLDNVLSPPLRKLVVPLFDAQRSLEELVAEANERVGAPVETPEDAVRAMLASDDGWLRAVGVYMAGRLRLHALRDEVRRFASTPDPLLRETVRVALARLEAGPPSPAVPRPAARVEEFEHEPPPVGNYGVG
jgi:AAA family ATP:ADP antiporter